MIRRNLILTRTLSLCAWLAMDVYAARTVVVDGQGDGDFRSLKEAVATVKAGDTIIIRTIEPELGNPKSGLFRAGISYESDGRVLQPKLSLQGCKDLRLRGFRTGEIKVEDCEDIIIERARVEGRNVQILNSRRISLRDSAVLRSEHYALYDGLVTVLNSDAVEITGNLIWDAWMCGVKVAGRKGDAPIRITRNTIGRIYPRGSNLESYPGMKQEYPDQYARREAEAGSAIVVQGSIPVEIQDNILASNWNGLMVSDLVKMPGPRPMTLRHNVFIGNQRADIAEAYFSTDDNGVETLRLERRNAATDPTVRQGGNSVVDPQFQDPDSLDLSLRAGSPALRLASNGGRVGASDEALQRANSRGAAISDKYCLAEAESLVSLQLGRGHGKTGTIAATFALPLECCRRGSHPESATVAGWSQLQERAIKLLEGVRSRARKESGNPTPQRGKVAAAIREMGREPGYRMSLDAESATCEVSFPVWNTHGGLGAVIGQSHCKGTELRLAESSTGGCALVLDQPTLPMGGCVRLSSAGSASQYKTIALSRNGRLLRGRLADLPDHDGSFVYLNSPGEYRFQDIYSNCSAASLTVISR